MAEKNPFIQTLNEKFTELLKLATDNKYTILVPPKKLITPNMLTQQFYENHIFYKSKYDETIYINLTGKVLKLIDMKFVSYLGWKGDRKLEFQIKDQYTLQTIQMISIDNVCDVTSYNNSSIPNNTKGEGSIKRFNTGEEYKNYYNNYDKISKDYTSAVEKLDRFCDLMKNNCIFMKGFEEFYSIQFLNGISIVIDAFKGVFDKQRAEDSIKNTVVFELVDTLVNNRMYSFLFGKLVDFHEEEEEELRNKLKEMPIKSNLKDEYKDCKFEKPLELLHELEKKHNVFEKVKILTEIAEEISKEAQQVMNMTSKKTYNPQGDEILNFWEYLILNSDAKNLIAEAAYLKQFQISNAAGVGNYLSTAFISAMESVVNNVLNKDVKQVNQSASYISTQQIQSVPKSSVMQERSQSMAAGRSKLG